MTCDYCLCYGVLELESDYGGSVYALMADKKLRSKFFEDIQRYLQHSSLNERTDQSAWTEAARQF